VKKLAIAVALCVSLIGSPVQAKTFVGVLWPMFGPLPAIGLVELVSELKMMPDVEVSTYLHQDWPNLVNDLARQPPGTRTVVIGYSLGANSTAFVANKTKYIDEIIALQPSMLSWNPPVTGRVGKMIEVYNPDPWETFGGMGSKKLIGPNIEYIANHDSHPGAQFSFQFRDLVKSEIARVSSEDRVEMAQAPMPRSYQVAQSARSARPERVAERTTDQQRDRDGKDRIHLADAGITQADMTQADRPQSPALAAPEQVAQAQPKYQPRNAPKESVAFLDTLSSAVDSGDLSAVHELTPADLMNYAKRTHPGAPAPADHSQPISRL
jgi:alpha/beta superfamily hydrolase